MRDCENCKNHTDKGCTKWKCEFEPTTKNDLGVASELEKNSKKLEKETNYTWEDVSSVMDAMEYRTNSLIENIKSEILHFANAHCSGDDINIYDVIKVIDDCCEAENSTTKNDLGVDCIVDVLGSYTDLDIPYKREIAENILAKLPSVTPQEPKTGHWISTETKGVRYAFWCRYKCSLCGGLSDRTNFCPNCGCRMVEPQESEE